MMKIIDVFQIKGRGTVATTVTDGPCPLHGTNIIRTRDGAVWTITGVERFCKYLRTVGEKGESVGLLLRGDAVPLPGDEIERF